VSEQVIDLWPETIRLKIAEGVGVSIPLNIDDDGTPLDVSAWSFAATIGPRAGAPASVGFTFDTSTAASGTVTAILASTDTRLISDGYWWDLKAKDDNGVVYAWWVGQVDVIPEVTVL
jgi:hypothetical protein